MSKAQFHVLRNTVSTAESDLSSTQKTWAYFHTNFHVHGNGNNTGKSILVPNSKRVAIVCFDHEHVDADTATAILYGYPEKGDAEFICSVNLTSGKQTTNDATARYYCDTFASLTNRWIGSVGQYDYAAGDGIAKLVFDTYDLRYIICLFTAISATDDVRAKIRFTERS